MDATPTPEGRGSAAEPDVAPAVGARAHLDIGGMDAGNEADPQGLQGGLLDGEPARESLPRRRPVARRQ
jgi:hypothetical protein